MPSALSQIYWFEDFTLASYRRVLELARKGYSFRGFRSFESNERFILWRHDLDHSISAGLRLARLEAELDVRATYFVLPGSDFYNILSVDSLRALEKIKKLGHEFGLHFDASRYSIESEEDLSKWLTKERMLLADCCGLNVAAFSFHNPNELALSFRKFEYAGMVNTYAAYFRDNVGYCSDSNGIWRHERLQDVLEADSFNRLQVLTHPEWWAHDSCSPRVRLFRCVDERSRELLRGYHQERILHGRPDVFELNNQFELLDRVLGERAMQLQMHWLRGERELVLLELWRELERQLRHRARAWFRRCLKISPVLSNRFIKSQIFDYRAHLFFATMRELTWEELTGTSNSQFRDWHEQVYELRRGVIHLSLKALEDGVSFVTCLLAAITMQPNRLTGSADVIVRTVKGLARPITTSPLADWASAHAQSLELSERDLQQIRNFV